MKKIAVILLMLPCVLLSAADVPEVNKKTIQLFQVAFKEATDAVWYAEENSDYVYFTLHQIKTKMKYDKEGNFINCLRTYKEENLPLLVRIRLKESYGDKKITSVTEFTTVSAVEFHVNMEDEKNIYLLKSDPAGVIEVLKRIRKK